MATTTATVSISSSDLQPGSALSLNASSTLMQTGLTTGLELIGNLGAGDWMWMPWNMGDAAAEINIEAEPTGATIPYEYAIFKSTYTLPAKT